MCSSKKPWRWILCAKTVVSLHHIHKNMFFTIKAEKHPQLVRGCRWRRKLSSPAPSHYSWKRSSAGGMWGSDSALCLQYFLLAWALTQSNIARKHCTSSFTATFKKWDGRPLPLTATKKGMILHVFCVTLFLSERHATIAGLWKKSRLLHLLWSICKSKKKKLLSVKVWNEKVSFYCLMKSFT